LYQAFVVPLLLINNDNDGQYRSVFISIFFVISATVDVAEQQITPSLFNQHSFLDSLRVGMGPPEKNIMESCHQTTVSNHLQGIFRAANKLSINIDTN